MAISRSFHCLVVGFFCCGIAGAQQFTISTVAGNGSPGFSGDSGSATAAQVMFPGGVAVDSSGKIYIADSGNHRVRVVSGGTITTFAGKGTAAYSGDGKAANAAEVFAPAGVSLDSKGNVYIADTGNHVIRMVNSSGVISTVAGNNSLFAGYSGDTGVATSGQVYSPAAVIADSAGNLYISDSGNNVVRKVTVTTNIISTLVGGAATFLQLNHPTGLALDASGALYIADTNNRRIVKFANGTPTPFAGNGSTTFSGDNGPATLAGISDPTGVAVDTAGNVYITDTFNSRIRRVTPDGIITTVAGTGRAGYTGDGGPATAATLNFPRALTVDNNGNVYVDDTGNNVIRLLTASSPAILSNGVVNAAKFTPQISPGALASVFGANIAGANASASLPLTNSLGGVSVTVNGKPAPILFVSAGQVNFQVPWDTPTGTATVVINNGRTSNSATVSVVTAGPGIFTYGSNRAVVQNSDFSLNAANNPAKVGSTIMAYLTGSGPVSPAVASGAISPTSPLAQVTSPDAASIGGTPAQVAFAGLAPGFVGLLQVNVVVPTSLATGDYPLIISINGEPSNAATISVTK